MLNVWYFIFLKNYLCNRNYFFICKIFTNPIVERKDPIRGMAIHYMNLVSSTRTKHCGPSQKVGLVDPPKLLTLPSTGAHHYPSNFGGFSIHPRFLVGGSGFWFLASSLNPHACRSFSLESIFLLCPWIFWRIVLFLRNFMLWSMSFLFCLCYHI